MTGSDKRSLGLLRADRFRRSTVSCVGAERTWRIGYSKSSAFRLMRRRCSREWRALGFRKISARPRHKGQNEFAVEDFKKTSPPGWGRSEPGSRPSPRSTKFAWQDEAEGSARKPCSPGAGRDAAAAHGAPGPTHEVGLYLWCKSCPARGVGAGLVLPRCNTQAMPMAS